jgi:pyruvate/2-oxoglutarate dehydrogenase complex dihydrolipoamide acyltransferase (E2) component
MSEFPVRIPKVSMAVEDATVIEWLIEDSQPVHEGAALYLLETDKVETEIDAPASGVIHWTADLGETYAVGTQIGYIDTGV